MWLEGIQGTLRKSQLLRSFLGMSYWLRKETRRRPWIGLISIVASVLQPIGWWTCMKKINVFTYQSHGPGWARPRPSCGWQFWPGLAFEQAKARLEQHYIGLESSPFCAWTHGERILITYQARVHWHWHNWPKWDDNGGFNIALINDSLLEAIANKIWDGIHTMNKREVSLPHRSFKCLADQ